MAAKVPKNPKRELLGRAELSRQLKVADKTVDSWRRRGVPTEGTAGAPKFDLAAVVEWRIERARLEARRDDGTIDLASLRARRALADTELSELALEEARGELVPIDVVCSLLGDVLDNVRSRLLGFPGRYAARLARLRTAAKIKAALQGATREVLEELSSGDAIGRRAREEASGAPSRVRTSPRSRSK